MDLYRKLVRLVLEADARRGADGHPPPAIIDTLGGLRTPPKWEDLQRFGLGYPVSCKGSIELAFTIAEGERMQFGDIEIGMTDGAKCLDAAPARAAVTTRPVSGNSAVSSAWEAPGAWIAESQQMRTRCAAPGDTTDGS